MMNVPLWAWLATTFGLVALLALDLVIVDRKPHKVTAWEAGRWVILYVACAVVFGLLVWLLAGGRFAGEFFSGYLTEYSLSVDNLFVFLVIMSAFKVPQIHQHRVLLIGIVIALVLRSVLIMAGSLVISKFFAIFYVFGAFLIFTAYRMVRGYDKPESDSYSENALLRRLRKQDAASGVGPAQLSALSVLVFAGPKTLGELAAAEQVKPPTMSRVVAGLTRSHLIEITRDSRDARRMHIRATAKGTLLLQQGRQRRVDYLAQHLGSLTTSELTQLSAVAGILERLLRNWP